MQEMYRYLRGSRWYMLAATVLNMVFACMNVYYTDIFRRYFDSVQGGNTDVLMQFASALIFGALA